MRALWWAAGAVVVLGGGFAACATGDDPGTSFNAGTGGGGVGGNGDGGDDGDGGSQGPNAQSGPGPSSVTSVTSTSGNASTTSATTSTTTGTPTSSSTGDPPCGDQGMGEPGNDTIAGAYDMGEIGSPDGDGSQMTGNLREPDDVDWYKYTGSDDTDGLVDPSRSTVGSGIRTCMFAECTDGDTEFDCPSETVETFEGAIRGCCWNGNQEVSMGGFNCTGTISDDADIYIKVEHPDGPGCESYTINYHY